MSATCRFCSASLSEVFVSLGHQPLSNAYLSYDELAGMEPTYPLEVYVCSQCFLVQLPEFESPESIFGSGDYAYFSSYSKSWLDHARRYCDMMVERFGLGSESLVVEVASNDGYLLQYFAQKGIPVLGIEPAENCARIAIEHGIPTQTVFFGAEEAERLVAEGSAADLIVGNNVVAHVPDLNDFIEGIRILLKPDGVATLEFPHLVRLVEGLQFDTIYHEHFSYFSFTTIKRVFEDHGLAVFDVEELPTHGGSLRVYACHAGDTSKPTTQSVERLVVSEAREGVTALAYYQGFEPRVREAKRRLLEYLISAIDKGHRVAGYGAPAKGNTLLNYCGVRSDMVDFTVDLNPHKQGRYLPGSHIPIFSPDHLLSEQPDRVLVLPWNIKDEITLQMSAIREWGGRFVIPLPSVEEQ